MNVVVEMENQAKIQVEVDQDNVVLVEGKKAQSFKEVLELLTAEKNANNDVNDLELILDPDSTHEMRIQVIDAATQAGFLRVSNKIQEL